VHSSRTAGARVEDGVAHIPRLWSGPRWPPRPAASTCTTGPATRGPLRPRRRPLRPGSSGVHVLIREPRAPDVDGGGSRPSHQGRRAAASLRRPVHAVVCGDFRPPSATCTGCSRPPPLRQAGVTGAFTRRLPGDDRDPGARRRGADALRARPGGVRRVPHPAAHWSSFGARTSSRWPGRVSPPRSCPCRWPAPAPSPLSARSSSMPRNA